MSLARSGTPWVGFWSYRYKSKLLLNGSVLDSLLILLSALPRKLHPFPQKKPFSMHLNLVDLAEYSQARFAT